MKILLFIWYAYATGTHFGTHFEILGGTLFGTQFTEKSTLGPEKYLVTSCALTVKQEQQPQILQTFDSELL